MSNNRKEQASNTNVGNATTTRQMNKTTLYSLPDEALGIIFRHLDAFDKSLTCQKRDAFSLALTNKRLLGLFRCHLSSITPRISNESLPTVALPHMRSVIRLAGNWLRELHVSKASYDILPLLPDLCPNLRKLALDLDFRNKHISLIQPLFSKLRSLSINRPSRKTLQSLMPPPEELHLTELRTEFTEELVEILRHPLKKFHLHIGCDTRSSKLSDRLLSDLRQVCPDMEELCLEFMPLHNSIRFCMEQLLRDVKSVQRNATSKCQKMVLHGEGLSELVTHAHPRAFVEISKGEQTVVDDAGNCYAKGIVSTADYLREPFLNMIPQITEIVITSKVDARWKDLLKGRRFKRVVVRSPEDCEGFELSAEVVEVHVQMLLDWDSETDWKWLQDVDEVKLVGRSFGCETDDNILVLTEDECSVKDTSGFLRSLALLLKTFRGTRVWLQTPYRLRFRKLSQQVRYEAVNALEALNRFEAGGGDATTLRKMLDVLVQGSYRRRAHERSGEVSHDPVLGNTDYSIFRWRQLW